MCIRFKVDAGKTMATIYATKEHSFVGFGLSRTSAILDAAGCILLFIKNTCTR